MTDCDLPSGHSSVLSRYLALPSLDASVQAEYIWIGGTGQDIRSKTRTLVGGSPKSLADLPIWNFDGSSTGQASGDDSEVLLRPVKFVRDPFRPNGRNVLVLCECINAKTKEPFSIKFSNRWKAKRVFDHPTASKEEPWFGMEQEYTLFDAKSSCRRPLGWPDMYDAFPKPQGQYYCGVGAQAAYGRGIAEAHYRCCLYSGLTISGINAEVMPGQWEFQIGPVCGIDAGDQMWLARYMLKRVAEDFGAIVSFQPKPVMGDWNGAGMHTNFSTLSMREEGGFDRIMSAVKELSKKHSEHIAVYGKGNDQRLSGMHETAPIDRFSYGVADRGSSIRIPRQSEEEGKGYFEDRRPAANCDPYEVTSIITETSLALKMDRSPIVMSKSGKIAGPGGDDVVAVVKDSTVVD